MPKQTNNPKPNERLTHTINETCAMLGVSRTTVYGLIRDGVLDAIKLRNRTLISREQIVRLAAGNARPAAGDGDARPAA